MKVLISCFACSPYQGSEPGMGWNFVRCLSHLHELHIITSYDFYDDIERYFKNNKEEKSNYHFYFIKSTYHNTLRKIWPPSYYWFYRAWQKKVYHFAKELDLKENFDVVHQLNMTGFRECGYLWKLNKPLIWGPTGGMHQSPWVLLPYIGLYGMVFYGLRNIINLKDIYIKRNPQIMANKCKAILAATQDTHDVIKNVWGKNSIVIPEVGFFNNDASNISKRDSCLKIVWSGQHTPAKALNFLLDALYECKHKDHIELHVLGIGRYTSRWKKMANQKGLNNIIWHGWIKRNDAIKVMKECHLLCITSMADLTSSVLMEGLSYGLPTIAFNRFGFANVITPQCGIKIEIHSKKQVVRDYAEAIDFLFEHEEKRYAMALGAFKRARNFSWDKKSMMIDSIYNTVIK